MSKRESESDSEADACVRLCALQAEAEGLALRAASLLDSGRTSDRRALYAQAELLAMRLSALQPLLLLDKDKHKHDEGLSTQTERDSGNKNTETERETETERDTERERESDGVRVSLTESVAERRRRCEALSAQLSELADKAKLLFSRRQRSGLWKLLGKLDEFFRLFVVWSFLIVAATLVGLPCIFIVPIDYLLTSLRIISPSQQISVLCKRFVGYGVVKLSGIHLVTENEGYTQFGKECALICFSHASTMDAFIIAGVVPVRQYTLSKSDLYLIPFFSWCLIAFGGIPIDRNNRDKAVKSVSLALSSAQHGDCVGISPEGTRSKSGQILPFKKGPFYMWETLKTPIVPLIIYGAYEIYPPGHNISLAGKVYCRILKPIPPNAATTRDEMSNIVRTKMLEAWRDGPPDAGCELTFAQWIEYYFWVLSYFISLWLLWHYVPIQAIQNYFNTDRYRLVMMFFGSSIGITLVFYIYFMYLSLPLASMRQKLFGSQKSY